MTRLRMLAGILYLLLLCAGAIAADEPPAGVTLHRELRYHPGRNRLHTLDLALPAKEGVTQRPAIVVIHGGGWIEGDKSSFSTTAKDRAPGSIVDFAQAGFVAATINYRLAGEAPYPAALDDCRAAIRWLRAHADQYGLDRERIGAYGNSAGGHLALLLAMMPDEPPSAGEPHANEPSRVQAAVSDSGPLDLTAQHTSNRLRTVVERFMGGAPDAERAEQYRRASPSSYAAEKCGPLLFIYGQNDEQVDVKTADDLVAALGRSGHPHVSYVRLTDVGHCPHSLIRVPYLQAAVVDFFTHALAPREGAKR